ncbi:hypothetical protein [Actinoplanes sp. NPDC026623]|uniref:hypothetical protein n=1 Tax=Actinoplanes sp. NPDC026623 TaxID=3155610 RepID=UPI0033EF7C82
MTSVSACKYELSEPSVPKRGQLRLMSSLRLAGVAADRAIRQIAQAPTGGGPDVPGCPPEIAYGSDAIVLRVRSAAGQTEIMLRYSGCVGNGFDDGTGVRGLTAAAAAPFTAGPNALVMLSSPVYEVLTPHD